MPALVQAIYKRKMLYMLPALLQAIYKKLPEGTGIIDTVKAALSNRLCVVPDCRHCLNIWIFIKKIELLKHAFHGVLLVLRYFYLAD